MLYRLFEMLYGIVLYQEAAHFNSEAKPALCEAAMNKQYCIVPAGSDLLVQNGLQKSICVRNLQMIPLCQPGWLLLD